MKRAPARGALTASVAAGLLCLTSGCTGFLSSQMTETVDDVAAGSNAHAGRMLISNAFVLGPRPDTTIPAGGRAAVYLTLYNRGPASQPGQPAPPAAPDRLVAASVGKAARAVRISGSTVKIPAEQRVNLTQGRQRMVLRGLTRPLSGGENVRLTLRFQRAGSVTFSMPVLSRTGPHATLSPFAAESRAQGSGTPSRSTPGETATPEEPSRTGGTAAPAPTGAPTPTPTSSREPQGVGNGQ